MSKDIKLSATRINTYLQCKQRYWFSYVEKLETLVSPVFALGLVCHETLEKAGLLWKNENLTKFSKKQIDYLMDYYDSKSVEKPIMSHEDHLDGRSMVLNRLKNFALGDKIIGIEDKFGFYGTDDLYTSSGVPLIGAIDKAIEVNKDTLLIVDYKTSRTVPDANKLRSDIQLSMYNLVAKQLYPQYKKVILSLDMLRKCELVYSYRTDDELEIFEKYLSKLYKKISELTKEKATPTINMLCGWCDHKNVCDEYKNACSKKEFKFLSTDNLSDTALLEEWEEVRSTKKILETRERELASLIMEKLKVLEQPVRSSTKEMVLRQNSRTTYDAKKLSTVIPQEDFAELVSVSPTKLRKYVDKNPRVKQLVEEASVTNFTSAFLATRKLSNI